MKINESNRFNFFLSIMIVIDLILITLTLISEVPDNMYYGIIVFDTALCIILLIEFFTRMWIAEDKRRFFLKNWTELIAAIPFDLIMLPFVLNYARFLRLIRVLKFIKVIALFSQFFETMDVYLKKTHLDEIFGVTLLVVLGSTLGLYLFDPSINSLFDSLWFVLSTITTVGYGDILPQSGAGRMIGLFILIVGVLIFSTVTGAIASYFARRVLLNEDFNITENDDNIAHLKENLSFNRKNLSEVHSKVYKIDRDVESLKKELNEIKEELKESKELNAELREEIKSLNENLNNEK
ncbi:ion transporter [Methanobrevibacter sp.]|uniref:ion transporter n=1 Tax=Methanobrevibacter sp. TaxID=66852 RepID=UPI0025FC775A|nr:ion transporter [Methanobrevibacter sp.]MBQ2962740.1 ion transporter [Methanobrevibacter sp.]